ESKSCEIMVILTTNRVNKIAKALLRPGRMDSIISLKMPDADAAARLVALYGRDLFSQDLDFKQVGKRLAGMRPASIRECVERSKLIATLRLKEAIEDLR